MQADDVPAVTALAQRKREQYQAYQPQFWRVASDAAEMHRPFIEHMMNDPEWVSLVAVEADAVVGYLFARLVPPPPVYDPGGPSGFIDDFSVAEDVLWPTVGRQLLAKAAEALLAMGAVQVVVVCGHLDAEKRDVLEACGLSTASEWLVGRADGLVPALSSGDGGGNPWG